jgi:hypothetical protein
VRRSGIERRSAERNFRLQCIHLFEITNFLLFIGHIGDVVTEQRHGQQGTRRISVAFW